MPIAKNLEHIEEIYLAAEIINIKVIINKTLALNGSSL
jgi:hypothetical protein